MKTGLDLRKNSGGVVMSGDIEIMRRFGLYQYVEQSISNQNFECIAVCVVKCDRARPEEKEGG